MILMPEYGSKPPQIMALIHPHNRKEGMWQYGVQKQCTQGFGGKTWRQDAA